MADRRGTEEERRRKVKGREISEGQKVEEEEISGEVVQQDRKRKEVEEARERGRGKKMQEDVD